MTNLCPVPADFREVAPLHTMKEIQSIYRRGERTVRRWLAQTGVVHKNARSRILKHDTAEDIELCLTCPFDECREKCGRVAPF